MKRKIVIIAIAVLLIVGASTFVIVSRSSAPFTAEPQPRAVLEAADLDDTRRPVVAVTESGAVYMLAVAGDPGRLMLSMSHDGGDSFMPPQPVSPAGASVNAHGENGPSFYVRAMSTYAVWQQTVNGRAEIVFAKSQGMHGPFAAPVRVTDKPQNDGSFNGFSSMAVAPNGDIYVVWLDGRDKPDPQGTFSLYLAKSTDQGASFSKNIRIAGAVCPCCRPSLAFGPRGEVYVAWRKVFEGDVRDVVVAVSHDGGLTFSEAVKVADDQWVLPACPDVGPSLAMVGTRLYAAWMSEGKAVPGVRLSYSDDGGHTFSKPVIVSRGVMDATHPMLAAGVDQLLLAFQGRPAQSNGGWGKVRPYVVRIGKNAQASQPQAVGVVNASIDYPTVASAGVGKGLLAWTENDNDRSRVLLQRFRW
ncbi:MAG: glycoside hydrolase [Acidobacteriales bacterium]|nr:glycoside hydrolase [Terriglobales bacterium]